MSARPSAGDMMDRPLRIALEGPCCAGKTTLGYGLAQEFSFLSVTYVVDYSEYVGGGKFLPPPVPSSLAEEEGALKEFLLIEEARTATAQVATAQQGLILIDRSIHTLLAHCHSLQQMFGLDYFGLAQRIIQSSPIPLWPNLILYLDVTREVVLSRNKGKFAEDSIFINPRFNDGIRLHFLELARTNEPCVIWLDATMDIVALRRRGVAMVTQWIGPENLEKGI